MLMIIILHFKRTEKCKICDTRTKCWVNATRLLGRRKCTPWRPYAWSSAMVWNTVTRDILPTARPHSCIPCARLHHRGQERPIRVRAGGPDLPGWQSAGRCVPVPPSARTAHPAFTLDSHPQRPAQLSLGARGWRCKRHELVPQVRNIPYSLF